MRFPAPLHTFQRVATRTTACAPVLAALLTISSIAGAQRVDTAPVSATCDYRHCAFNIIAALHGLRVVRGADEVQVGTLGFFWTRDLSDRFDGEGREAARTAVRTRRRGALFTDVGLALLATGAARAATNDLDRGAANLMLAGAAIVGVSVPLQFRADKHLARAVWQHNARYAWEIR